MAEVTFSQGVARLVVCSTRQNGVCHRHLASLGDETLRTRPERRESLLAKLVKLDRQIAKGTENLLLLAPADISAATALLAQ